MRKIVLLTLNYSLFFFCTLLSQSQEGATIIPTGKLIPPEEYPNYLPDSLYLFDSEEPLEITIESDFRDIRKNKFKDEYRAALLHFTVNDSILVKRKIRIKPRGEFRKRYCHFPPIRVNFKKSKFYIKDFMDLEKIKMVTNCRSSQAYEIYLLKEYLVYKLFNLFTDKSFKARLLKVKYVDTGKKNRSTESFAFIIEELEKLAARNKGGEVKQTKISQKNMSPEHMTMVSVFEYMIGNTDWSVPGQHNIKVIRVLDEGKGKSYPVPYDFDFSGCINTIYASPPVGIDTKSVEERYFLGYCRSEEEFQAVIDLFLEKEEAVYATINDFKYLEKNHREAFLGYIKSFYNQIKKPKAIKYAFQRTCRS